MKKNINDIDLVKKVILDYINDEHHRRAILVSGEWGIGKTYFIKETIIPSISDSYKLPTGSIIYISLYGINNTKELEERIFQSIIPISKNIKENKDIVNFLKGLKTSFSGLLNRLANGFGDLANATLGLITGNTILNNLNVVMFFDDLERCCVNIEDIWGVINTYVEQTNKKVIIICNENVLNEKFNKDLSKHNSKQNKYEQEKEKSIGLTIKFNFDIRNAYDSLISCQGNVKQNDTLDFLKKYKEDIICEIESYKNKNLRIFVDFLQCFDKFHKEMIDNKAKLNKEFLEKEKIKICKYISRHIYKISKYPDDFFVNYKSIDDYINDGNLNLDGFIEEILKYNNEYVKTKELALNQLLNWNFKTDEEVNALLLKLKNEIKNDKYSINSLHKLIARVAEFNEMGFVLDVKDEIIESLTKQIGNDYYGLDDWINNNVNNPNEMVKAILNKVQENAKNNYLNEVKNKSEEILNNEWNEDFILKCEKYFNDYIDAGCFLYYLDIDKANANIENNLKSVFYFNEGLNRAVTALTRYRTDVRDDFQKDRKMIESFITIVDDKINETVSIVDRAILKELKDTLHQYLKIINVN